MAVHTPRENLWDVLLGLAWVLFTTTGAKAAAVSATPAQTFTGIGGSGAWWPNDLWHFPETTRQNLSSLLFSPSGLGLSSYRYNVGAGGVNVSNPTRAPETFYVSPGVYNFSADPQGVYFLNEAAKRGVASITAFANSAPPRLTSGGASCNGQFVNGNGNAYGTFLSDVVAHFRSGGINISLISPMNEPDSTFGPSPCGQEGMQVMPSQRAEVVNGLWNALSARGLASTVGILADESSSLGNAGNEYSAWLPQVIDKVAALVHHTYDFPSDASYTSYVTNTNKQFPGKQTWMSEICCSLGNADGTGKGYTQGYDPTIKNALMFSSLVFQSLVLVNEPHYDFWTLVSNGLGCSPLNNPSCATNANSNGWNDGLIYYDGSYAGNGNFQLYIKKQFWTYKHFGNFVKPGSQRRAITGSDATKFMMGVTDSSNFYVIAMNPNTTDSTLTLTFPESVCATEAHRTSASEDFASIAAATQSGSSWSLPLKGTSLNTYIFARRSC
ncbi:glycoside hydrolase family 30 protein [Macrolepiota fuliginosa MF-IS2]|uniref:Glycoside hydrolase family 30 protein n=1 Tax=Macrolepiota fuliginosa MF-IS2 TaxID=1400762 RepID=A0A9P6BZX1_9AGAR|nr:glycoside hydrolase family 30 protein [Macrolepiota fuliginosa MF-IS2]